MANYTLQLLHMSDGEGSTLTPQTAPIMGALIDRFDNQYANTLVLAGGDNFIPGPFLTAGADPALNAVVGTTALGRPDIAIDTAFGIRASAIGNHEFALGSQTIADAITPAGTWQELPADFFGVLDYALTLARDSGGAYDPTVGPLVNLWGFGPGTHEHKVPAAAAIDAARARIGWQRVQLDREHRRVLQPGDVYLDLSSIAKGFGTDQIARFLESRGIDNYLVDISGELRARGARPDGSPWQVAIEKPGAAAGAVDSVDQVQRTLVLKNRSIATSGDYRHFFEDAGRNYSHHIDPRSGWPVEHRIASVTTVAGDCMQADAMGTTIMVLGADAGLAFAEQRGVAVLVLLHDGDRLVERMTPAFAALLKE